MKRRARPFADRSAMELVEESFYALRRAPAAAWLAYAAGALPFALGLLFFWAEMSQSGSAWKRAPAVVLGMVLLFIWLKTWQTVFTQSLLSHFTGRPSGEWTLGRLLRTLMMQTAWQPTGLFLVPIAAVIAVPFGWVFAFYQSFTVLGDGRHPSSAWPRQQAMMNCKLWARQNHVLLAILSVLAFAVLLNWIGALVAVPQLLKSIFGIETVFSRSSDAYLNTTFFATVGVLTWLTIDPLVKAIYALRCFYGVAKTSGEDLRVELRQTRSIAAGTLLVCVLAAFGAATSTAAAAADADPGVRSQERAVAVPAGQSEDLDQAIEQTLNQRKYVWRFGPQSGPPPDEREQSELAASFWEGLANTLTGWLKGIGSAIGRVLVWVGDFIRWILPSPRPPTPDGKIQTDWTSPLRVLVLILLVALVAVVAWFLYRAWQRRRKQPTVDAEALSPVAPDLTEDYVAASDLPEDQWLQLARSLIDQGDLRLALRAFYLASLSTLAERNLIAIARFKSNLDYVGEVRRRAHALPGLAESFSQNVAIFDRAWYGLHEVTNEILAEFAARVERIRAS